MVFCDGRESIAVGVSESVDIVKIDVQPNSSGVSKYGKPNLVRRCKLVNETPVCVDNYSNDTHTVLAVATNKGNIYGWDLRCSLPVWKLTNPAHHGGISSFHVDKSSKSWIVTGSHRGVMSLWDLRFQIPVKSVLLPTKSSIHKIEAYSKEPSLVDGFTNTEDTLKVLIASGRNEISSWNMSTMQCDEVFCARTLEEKIGKYVKSWTVRFNVLN
jgi:phosphoinositide-3-kinase regulatory subunit 4